MSLDGKLRVGQRVKLVDATLTPEGTVIQGSTLRGRIVEVSQSPTAGWPMVRCAWDAQWVNAGLLEEDTG